MYAFLSSDELPSFNETWKGSAREHLPGWNQGFDMIHNGDIGKSKLHFYFT